MIVEVDSLVIAYEFSFILFSDLHGLRFLHFGIQLFIVCLLWRAVFWPIRKVCCFLFHGVFYTGSLVYWVNRRNKIVNRVYEFIQLLYPSSTLYVVSASSTLLL